MIYKLGKVPSRVLIVALLFAISLSLGGVVYAQTQNGNIIGQIADPAGALVPGVTVTAVNGTTQAERKAVTASDGTYLFSLIPTGEYSVTVEHAGFKKYVNRDVRVHFNENVRVDVKLEIGEITSTIDVTGEVAAIQTEASNITTDRDYKWISRAPGGPNNTVSFGPTNTVTAAGGYNSYNGTRQQQGTATYDGVEFDYFRNYIPAFAAEEVKVEHTVAPAAYQTQVNVGIVSKGGGNTPHGRVSFTLANPAFNAISDPRVHTRPRGLPTWQAGFNVNGPLYIPKLYDGRNKTFWSFGFTKAKNGNAPFPLTQTQPPPVWRRGDFSNPALFGGTLRDPVTNAPFPGNIIPANRISPIATKLMSYLSPTGDTSTTVPIIMSWDASVSESIYWRADHKINDRLQANVSTTNFKQSFTGKGFHDRIVLGWPGAFALKSTSPLYAVGTTYTISPNIVNETRFGLHNDNGGYVSTPDFDVAKRIQDIGWTGIPAYPSSAPPSGPNVRIAGFFPWDGWTSSPYHAYHWHGADNLSMHKGLHNIQMGIEYKHRAFDNAVKPREGWGVMNMTGRFTGNAVGDFLLGLPETVTRQNVRPLNTARNDEWGMYVQDSFRVTPSFTLNYGLRYDYSSPLYDERDLMFAFDTKTGNVVVPTDEALKRIDPNWPLARNPVVTASAAGFSRHLVKPDRNNFNPRFGFAWRPFNDDKTVIRGGYGVYIVPEFSTGTNTGGSNQLQWLGPFALNSEYNNVNNTNPAQGAQPFFSWPVGIPGPALAGAPPLPSFTFTNPNFFYPYSQQANLTIEREVGGQRVRVSYIMTKDTNLGYRRNINLPQPIPGVAFTQDRRPFKNFGNLSIVENGGSSTYHAGEAVLYLKRAFGFSGEIGFAYSKQITDIPNARFEGLAGAGTLNPWCRVCDRAESPAVPPMRQVNYVYWDVPYGKGKRFGSGIHPVLNQLLGGWELTTDLRFANGQGVDANYTGSDPLGLGITSGRPDLVGDWRLPKGTANEDRWFNAQAFAVPANNIGRVGNSGRAIIRAPGRIEMQLGIYKNFNINEHHRMLFTSTISNPFNHIIFGYNPNNPSNPIQSPTASRLPGIIIGGRSIQFHLGYEF
ncbi:MAG: carboxypeptidase regulatory-like domain-containing protein [Acidobacteria bacterium]|nr:carboxypeptidase regulatory-like domain-containing protein [Acidobacteriota bacterium]